MFETSVIRVKARAPQRRAALLSMSLVAHAAVIVGVFVASIATVKLPTTAPKEASIPFIGAPPPPLGTPDGGQKPKAAAAPPQQQAKRDTPPPRDVAPQFLPEHTATVAQTPGTSSDDGGSKTGNSGPIGVPWGVKDSLGPMDAPPSTATVAQTPEPPIVIHVDKAPIVIRRVSPMYPALGIKIRKNGFAVVDCTIDTEGRIRDAHIVSSSWPPFEEPALEAVRQWLFVPGTSNGKPVNVEFELRVTFEVH